MNTVTDQQTLLSLCNRPENPHTTPHAPLLSVPIRSRLLILSVDQRIKRAFGISLEAVTVKLLVIALASASAKSDVQITNGGKALADQNGILLVLVKRTNNLV